MPYRSLQPAAATGNGSEEILQDSHTIRLKAFKRDEWHNISIKEKTCDCPAFHKDGQACEHLTALGVYRLRSFIPKTRPTFRKL